jgi:putative MATE family efflux protein
MLKSRAVDLTQGNILGRIIVYALPVIAGNMLQQLYNVTDTLIVGKTLGVIRLAAVGVAGSMNFLMVGFVMGVTGGCAVLTSQACGAGRESEVRRTTAAHMAIAAALTVLMTAGFLLSVKPLLRIMNTTPDIFGYADSYITVIYQGIAAVMLYNFLSATLSAIGDSRTPLMFLLFSSLLNIALDLIFIIVFGWDVEGAAAATVASQLVSGLLCLWYVCRREPQLIPHREDWRGLMPVVCQELRVGIPMGFQFTIIALGMMVLQSVLNGFGAEAVAAYTVGGRLHELMQNPLTAMSVVMATYAGQNKGARKYDRISEGVRKCALMSFLTACLIGGAVFLVRDQAVSLFLPGEEPAVSAYAHQYMNWECPSLSTLGFLFVYRGAIQGLGDGFTVMMGGIFELAMRAVIPILTSGTLGFLSVCIAGPAAWTSSAVLMIAVFYFHMHRLNSAKRSR